MKKIIIPIVIVLILVASAFALDRLLDDEEEAQDYKDTYEKADLGWYNVANWERQICGDFHAGRSRSSSGEESSIRSLEYYTNDIIVELNAKKGKPIIFNQTSTGSIYEVSWYIQPVSISVNYVVSIKMSDESEYSEKYSGPVSLATSGYAGYQAFFIEEEKGMKSATLEIPEADLKMTVPFVGEENVTVDDVFKISDIELYEEKDYCNEPGCQIRTRVMEEQE